MCESQNGEDDPGPKTYVELCDFRQKEIARCNEYRNCDECPLSISWVKLSSHVGCLGDDIRKSIKV